MSSVVEQTTNLKKVLGKQAEQFIDLFEILYSYALDQEVNQTAKGLHREVKMMYEKFCQDQLKRKARFTNADYKAIKEIINFLLPGNEEAEVKKILLKIFITWDDLSDYYKTKTEFAQMWNEFPHLLTHAKSYYVGDPISIRDWNETQGLGGSVAARNIVKDRRGLGNVSPIDVPISLMNIVELKVAGQRDLFKKLTWLQRYFEKQSAYPIKTLDEYRTVNEYLVRTYPKLFLPEIVYAFQLAIKGFVKGIRTPKGYSIDKIINGYKEHIKLYK